MDTDGDGGGIYVCGGPTLITNCVIWGNEHSDEYYKDIVPDNIYQCGGQSITCSYSAIEGGFQGNYNIPLFDGTPLQPFFVHPSASSGKDDTTSNVNWHIQEGSICINRGDNSAVTDSMDLSGLDRNLRDTVDIGCYETYYYRSHVLFNEESLVNCDSCVWNGATYYESGNYTHTETDANGYDNVGILHLTLNHSTDTEETVESINNYTWNGNVYTQSGDYTWVGIGENGCDSVVTLHLTITVGVDYYDGLDFKVYPNPTSNIVNVECIMKNEEWGEVELHLCDAYGRLLDVARANNHSPLQTAQIDLSRYATGVYFIKAVADGKTIAVRKVVRN